jgi:hypothetical protein
MKTTQTGANYSPYVLLYSSTNPINLREAVGVVKSLHQVPPR